MIQYRTPEWYKARIGKFTASSFGLLMANPADKTATWSKSSLNCIEKAVSQIYFNEYSERPDSDSTRWGIRNEALAIQEFVEETKFQYKETGFVLHPKIEDVGATPDAQIIENDHLDEMVIAQIKCPYNQKIHLKYTNKIFDTETLRKSKSEYYWQIQGEMWVTGAKHCYFVTFDPRLRNVRRLHFAKIRRDEEAIRKLSARVIKSIELRNKILREIRLGIRPPKPLFNYW